MSISEITNSIISSTSPALIEAVLTAVGAKKLYDDFASPIVKSAGIRGAKIFNALCAPIDSWSERRLRRFSLLSDEVTKKLSHKTPDEIKKEVPDYLLLPAINAYIISIDSNDLRNMYANLISRALLKTDSDSIHPAFVSILQNLAPKECLLLKFLSNTPVVPLIKTEHQIMETNQIKGSFTSLTDLYLYPASFSSTDPQSSIVVTTFSDFTLGPSTAPSNLVRLGLIHAVYDRFLTKENIYDSLLDLDVVKNDEKECISHNRIFNVVKGYMELTPFGKEFVDICIRNVK